MAPTCDLAMATQGNAMPCKAVQGSGNANWPWAALPLLIRLLVYGRDGRLVGPKHLAVCKASGLVCLLDLGCAAELSEHSSGPTLRAATRYSGVGGAPSRCLLHCVLHLRPAPARFCTAQHKRHRLARPHLSGCLALTPLPQTCSRCVLSAGTLLFAADDVLEAIERGEPCAPHPRQVWIESRARGMHVVFAVCCTVWILL